MDLNGYWQENKRFVLTVGAGALVFLGAFGLETSLFRDELNRTRKRDPALLEPAVRGAVHLAGPGRRRARERGAEGGARAARAGGSVPRAPRVRARPAAGSAANHYLRTLARVREDLLQRANRAGLEIESSLGMPELSPTVESEIVRYLEALDLVDSVADLALRARAKRIDKIQVRLDPGHATREGVGRSSARAST
jgi:hypothetical protein